MSTATITPGADTLFRVWLRGRLVCATNCVDRAQYALGAAKKAEAMTSRPFDREAFELKNRVMWELQS